MSQTPENQGVRFGFLWRLLGGLALLFVAVVGLASPFTFVLLPGVIGGVGVALLIRLGHRRNVSVGGALDGLGSVEAPARINFASIKVSGAAGLSLVVIAAVIAITVPRIGQTVGLGMVGGLLLAFAMVLWRRRRGGLGPNTGTREARQVLRDEGQSAPSSDDTPRTLQIIAPPPRAVSAVR